MKILDLALKDLTQILRDKKSLLFLAAMPILFTLFMGFAYKAGEEAPQTEARLKLAYLDPEPQARLNQLLFARLEASSVLEPVRMEQEAALASLRSGELAGALILPLGFGKPDGGGAFPQARLIAASGSNEGRALYQSLRVPFSQLLSAVETASLVAQAQGNPAEFAPALTLAWEKWEAVAGQERVRLERAAPRPQESWFGDNPYNQASPGILVQFAIMSLVTSAQILVNERKTRTLARMMTTTLRPWELVAGHLLALFGLVFLQTALLVLFGQFALGVDYLREPLGTLLVVSALGLWVAALGLLIGLQAKSDDQVVLFSMLAMFLFSALGGTWFPLEFAGGAFASLGRLMPSAWAMTGLQNLLIRGLGAASAVQPAAVLLAYALGFFLLALWRFRRVE